MSRAITMQGFMILGIIGTEKDYFAQHEILTESMEHEM